MQKKVWWFLVLAVAGIVAFAPLPLPEAEPAERVFTVHARSYEYHPAVLRVNPGDQVTLHLVSEDVVHGIYIDGYDLSVEADPGQTRTLVFFADREGSFRLRCSVTCGALHPFMIGKLEVGRSLLFWRGGGLAVLAILGALALGGPRREHS